MILTLEFELEQDRTRDINIDISTISLSEQRQCCFYCTVQNSKLSKGSPLNSHARLVINLGTGEINLFPAFPVAESRCITCRKSKVSKVITTWQPVRLHHSFHRVYICQGMHEGRVRFYQVFNRI